jgi:hypothetical protein
MKITQLAEEIRDYLNLPTPERWSGLTVGLQASDYVEASCVLDPVLMFESGIRGLYVIPVVASYNRQGSLGRQQIVQLYKSPVIAICLTIPFIGNDSSGVDVSSWDDVKEILDLREEIDELVAKHEWSARINTITAEPAQDVPLKNRWFLSVTEIEFESFAC